MSKEKQISEEELVSLLLKKSPEATGILYDRYAATLYGVIRRMLKSDEEAEIVFGRTFIKIAGNISQYNQDRDRFSAWMISVARNMAFEYLKTSNSTTKSQYQSIESLLNEADPSKLSGFDPELQGLKELILKMDIEYSQILYLLFFTGFSQSEVALKLNIPLGTVKSRCRTAISKLRNYLDKIPG